MDWGMCEKKKPLGKEEQRWKVMCKHAMLGTGYCQSGCGWCFGRVKFLRQNHKAMKSRKKEVLEAEIGGYVAGVFLYAQK
jgi:hypothetical protein